MNTWIGFRKLCVVLGLTLSVAGVVGAVETNVERTFIFSFTEENDRFVSPRTDKHYTQGLHLGLLWPDETAPWPVRPLTWVPDLGLASATHKYGLRLGQDMYTPVDLSADPPSVTDRPYAGWLYLGFVRESRGTVANAIPTLDRLEIDLGAVGSASLASDTQHWWHKVIGSLRPVGWPHQLHNEVGFVIRGDRQFKIVDTGTGRFLQAQVLPHLGFNLGNIQTSLRLGPQVRLGYNIPDEFAKIPPAASGWYLFSAVDGRVVGYNEFLDGNAFQNSASVAKEPVVLEVRVGLVLVLGSTQISYTYNYLSKEFKMQDKYDAYGSLNLTQTF